MNLYSTTQAAAYLGISADTLRLYLREKRLAPDRGEGRKRRFWRSTLDAFRPHIGERRAPGKGRRLIPAATWAEILRRYSSGERAASLAIEFGVSEASVYRKAADARNRTEEAA